MYSSLISYVGSLEFDPTTELIDTNGRTKAHGWSTIESQWPRKMRIYRNARPPHERKLAPLWGPFRQNLGQAGMFASIPCQEYITIQPTNIHMTQGALCQSEGRDPRPNCRNREKVLDWEWGEMLANTNSQTVSVCPCLENPFILLHISRCSHNKQYLSREWKAFENKSSWVNLTRFGTRSHRRHPMRSEPIYLYTLSLPPQTTGGWYVFLDPMRENIVEVQKQAALSASAFSGK